MQQPCEKNDTCTLRSHFRWQRKMSFLSGEPLRDKRQADELIGKKTQSNKVFPICMSNHYWFHETGRSRNNYTDAIQEQPSAEI